MSKKLLALVVGCAIALCVGLVGCGNSGGGGGAMTEKDVAGVWDIDNVDEVLAASMGDSANMTDQVKEMAKKLLPEICFLNMNADGTYQLVAFTASVEGTWKLDGNKISLTAEGNTVEGTIENGKMTLEANGQKMVFVKTGDTARAVPSEDELYSKVMELALSAMS